MRGLCRLVPSGSITYEADPSNTTLRRIQALMDGYNKVAGDHPQPRLLVHDAHGRDMIAMAARFGDGLAANMLPIEIEAISSFGHAEALGALASGFGDVHILLAPRQIRWPLVVKLPWRRRSQRDTSILSTRQTPIK